MQNHRPGCGREPQIYNAIKFGAMLENIGFQQDGVTQITSMPPSHKTPVFLPVTHIPGASTNGTGPQERLLFDVRCVRCVASHCRLDADRRCTTSWSGYTAKVAGTEVGVTEPQATFSACFGAPFMPLPPTDYAEMLAEKVEQLEHVFGSSTPAGPVEGMA